MSSAMPIALVYRAQLPFCQYVQPHGLGHLGGTLSYVVRPYSHAFVIERSALLTPRRLPATLAPTHTEAEVEGHPDLW